MRFTAFVIVFSVVFFSCQSERKKPKSMQDTAHAKKMLERINRKLVQEDRDLIDGYIKRHKLDGVVESETGLFYVIWGSPDGEPVTKGDLVEYRYRITLLDGTVCYESKPDSLGTFVVGHGGVESGLEQGILMMKQGQKAKFIMPPYLAHGLIGDAKRIPARSIIVYDLELLKVSK